MDFNGDFFGKMTIYGANATQGTNENQASQASTTLLSANTGDLTLRAECCRQFASRA